VRSKAWVEDGGDTVILHVEWAWGYVAVELSRDVAYRLACELADLFDLEGSK